MDEPDFEENFEEGKYLGDFLGFDLAGHLEISFLFEKYMVSSYNSAETVLYGV